MILGFSTINKYTNQPTHFPELILSGMKKHTLRKGYRWHTGYKIHMATGVRTKHYEQFNKNRPDLQLCKSTQNVKLVLRGQYQDCEIFIDDRKLNIKEMKALAINDGFNCLNDFWHWFVLSKDLPDQLIHWTDLRY